MVTAITGYCSRCYKVWTLDKPNGKCQWCGQSAHSESGHKSRVIKSRPRKQAEPHNNGYDQLPEPYRTFNKVAGHFSHKAMPEDREDLLQDIIYHLAKVHQSKRNNGNEPFTEAMMYRIASHVKDHYWYSHYKLTMGLDCQHCSKAQRHKCKEDWLYSKCPKAIKIEDLHKPIIDSEGNITELGELIADDKALDLDAWLDAGTFLDGIPPRLKGIAVKIRDGIPLDNADKLYLGKWRKREQKRLL